MQQSLKSPCLCGWGVVVCLIYLQGSGDSPGKYSAAESLNCAVWISQAHQRASLACVAWSACIGTQLLRLKCLNDQGRLQRDRRMKGCSTPSEASALDSNRRWRAVTPTLPFAVLQTLAESRAERLGSEAKSWCASAHALLLYPRCGAGCAMQSTHANCHWLVLLILEGDWALGRDPICVSHSDITSNVTDWKGNVLTGCESEASDCPCKVGIAPLYRNSLCASQHCRLLFQVQEIVLRKMRCTLIFGLYCSGTVL